MTNFQTTRLERIVRQHPLSDEEAVKCNKVREQGKKELPELIAKNNVSEEIRKLLNLETLETRNMDRLDFHDIAVWNIKKAIDMAFEAGRKLEKAKRKTRSGKRFHLLHVFGSVDPSIVGKSHKDYDSLLKAARKFIKSDDYTEGEDGLFYVVTTGNTVQVSPFDSSDIEDED